MSALFPVRRGALLLCLALSTALAAGGRHWTAPDADVRFEMSSADLSAHAGTARTFSLGARGERFRSELARQLEDAAGRDTSEWSAEEELRVHSVVGTTVSLERRNDGFTGGAHPYAGVLYEAWDVRTPETRADLLALFPEADVVAALKADPFIRKHVRPGVRLEATTRVSSLVAALDGGETCVHFAEEAVRHAFVFHHLEAKRVAVRVSFPYAAEACRGRMFVVALLLPVPQALAGPLRLAAARKAGFLMGDARRAKAPLLKLRWPAR